MEINITNFIPSGKENAISLRDLAQIAGAKERETKAAVRRARMDGNIICSGANGYFMPESMTDVYEFTGMMMAQAAARMEVIAVFKEQLARAENEEIEFIEALKGL